MMQSKRLIYVSLAILLLGSSFVSGPAQVMAAELATSASVQSSTPTTDAASTTEQPQSSDKKPANAVPSTATQVQLLKYRLRSVLNHLESQVMQITPQRTGGASY